MPIKSQFPDIQIPECNLLTYLLPDNKTEDDKPLWINAADPSISLSAPQTLSMIKRFGSGLDQLQIPKGKTVMVVAPNNIYVPIIYLTAIGSGRVFTAANPAYTTSELVHQMKTIRAAVVLTDPSNLEKVTEAAAQADVPQDRVFQFADHEIDTRLKEDHDVRDWRAVLSASVRDWRDVWADERDAKEWRWDPLNGQKAKDAIAVVNFSSGTTGLPKGVCTTHYNIVANLAQVVQAKLHETGQSAEAPASDSWLGFLPWYHAYAQMWNLLVPFKLRQPVYTMSKFELEPYISNIERYQIRNLVLVPPTLVSVSKRKGIENVDLSSVKWVMSAAAPLKRDLQNDISRKLGAAIVQSWGMTETTCTGLMIPGTMEDDSGSVGYLLPSTEAKLVDEQGNEVGVDQPGELWVRGPQMMKCYWENETATKDTLTEDAWLKTGDVAQHKDGKWWIVDRKKELIKVRGFQVAPAELEALLLNHDDVQDAAVVGLASNDQELPRAYVALRNAKQNKQDAIKKIKEYVQEKASKHKHLTGGVAIVDSIPRLLSGKIQRKVVKEWAKRDAEKLKTRPSAKL